MTDRVLRRIVQVEEARRALADELEALRVVFEANHRMRLEGSRMSEIFAQGDGPVSRRRVRTAWSRLNRALHAYRVEAIRSLIDDEGWTLSAAARLTGNARQVISRLYHETGVRRRGLSDVR
jgi:hypothetical protein